MRESTLMGFRLAVPVEGVRPCALGVGILSLMFLGIAFWNGFPVIFYDTGAYVLEGLGHVFLVERSPVYADLLLPRSLRHPRDLAATAARFASIRRAYEISMPVDLGLLGIRRGLADMAHGAAHWLAWQRDQAAYRQILRDGNYDIVHFNSPVLHRMVLPGLPAVTHMRDIILDSTSPVIDKLADGAGIIFIDGATRRPFARREGRMKAVTLNNPIDMRAVAQARALPHPRIGAATTVFSMIGRVSDAEAGPLANFRDQNSS